MKRILLVAAIAVVAPFFSSSARELGVSLPTADSAVGGAIREAIERSLRKVAAGSDLTFKTVERIKPAEALARLTENDVDIAWVDFGYAAGRTTWLKLFAWPGLVGDEGELSLAAWRLWNRVFPDTREFAAAIPLAITVFPPMRLFGVSGETDSTDFHKLKIRCPSPLCRRYVDDIGGNGVSVLNKNLDLALERNFVDAVMNAGAPPTYTRTPLTPLEAFRGVPWERPVAALVVSRETWRSLTDRQKKSLEAYTGENLSRTLARLVLEQEAAYEREYRASKKTVIRKAPLSPQNPISELLFRWRKLQIARDPDVEILEGAEKLVNPGRSR